MHELVADLSGQLAGGDEHEPARPPRAASTHFGDERYPEGNGLARARRGPAADVAPGEGVGDGGGLDREGLDDAPAGEAVDDVTRDAERGER